MTQHGEDVGQCGSPPNVGTSASRAPHSSRSGRGGRGRAGGTAIQKGLQAFTQYTAREGGTPGRAVVERFPGGTEHRTDIWISNQKTHRDKLRAAQLSALAGLGVDWAWP
ncbi:hypothetical protein ACFV30_19045 [Streptomyces sp. NPDC059752]|uniref:hypothetical protein n=1 Tax=unclassified Streptomyces TaxID=2593676 RepID=UPI00364B0296